MTFGTPIFGVREQLVMDYRERDNHDELPDDLAIKQSLAGKGYYSVDFDFLLQAMVD